MNFDDTSLPSSSSDEHNFSNNYSRITEKSDDTTDIFLPSEPLSNDNGFVVVQPKTPEENMSTSDSFLSWFPFYAQGIKKFIKIRREEKLEIINYESHSLLGYNYFNEAKISPKGITSSFLGIPSIL